ncbi:hypothetical protein HMPREF9413_3901 [Paenibacillus sp. HGF7]|nr:hypothetical protein HMPREF9413_3901 [Paenibacillus sp. HGF7]
MGRYTRAWFRINKSGPLTDKGPPFLRLPVLPSSSFCILTLPSLTESRSPPYIRKLCHTQKNACDSHRKRFLSFFLTARFSP